MIPAKASHGRVGGGSRVLATAVLAAGWACSPGVGAAARPLLDPGTPVVIVVIDTLRADRLGCYGNELDTSPELDAFAERAYVFEANSTQCNATFSSLTSIMTGLYPRTHRNYVAVPIAGTTRRIADAATLAERFHDRGYRTLAVVSHPYWSDEGTLLSRGWDERSRISADDPRGPIALANARYTNERLLPMLEEYSARDDGAPLFLWAHYFDPHTDGPSLYDPPASTRDLFLDHHLRAAGLERFGEELSEVGSGRRLAWIQRNVPAEDLQAAHIANGRALYDAEVRACDAGVGVLFRRLRRMHVYDRALIVVMADHGENLEGPREGEALQFTHNRLYEGVTHTPLMIKLPGQRRGERITALSQNIDLAPTLIELLGLAPEPAVEGTSLVPLLSDPGAAIHERVFVESSDNVDRAVKTDELKLIHHGGESPPQLFAWKRDPQELEELSGRASPGVVAELERAIDAFRPIDLMRVLLQPAAEPFEAAIAVELRDGMIEGVEGGPGGALSADGRRFAWEGTVVDDPVEFTLALQRYNVEMRWTLRHGGVEHPERVVWLGRRPLVETAAVPLWRAGPGPAPRDPRLVLEHHPDDGTLGLEAFPTEDERVDVELRYSEVAYERTFEALLLEGFGPLEAARAGVVRTRARGPLTALALLRKSDPGAASYELVRFDGHWPDPARVEVDGQGAREESVEFVFPHPVDGRITATLMAGAPEPLAPGAVGIWLQMGGGGGEADVELLDEKAAAELRALGYAR